MILSELMKDFSKTEDYKGELMADDFVLAICTDKKKEEDVKSYAVVQEHTTGVDSSLNSESNDKQYLRSGLSSTKKSTQRTFSITSDRYIGDEAQDYLDSIKYKNGEDAVAAYVYFNLKNGAGEKGRVSCAVNTDGGGNAGDNAGFNATLSKNGAQPDDFNWYDYASGNTVQTTSASSKSYLTD